MRRLSRREKRLVIVLCGIAALGATSFYMAPEQGPNPEEVIAYCVGVFRSAKEITIRTPDGKAPVTVTRDKDDGLFRRLEAAASVGGVALPQAAQPPMYVLDLVGEDGSETKDISVGFTVDSPKQPSRGKLAFVPREMGSPRGPSPAMALIIEDYLDPAAAKQHREQIRQAMKQFGRQQGGGGRGRAGRSGPAGGAAPGPRQGATTAGSRERQPGGAVPGAREGGR